MSKDIGVCEPCVEGKHHRAKFDTSGAKRSDSVLVHSDVCGKMSTQSLSGSEYFLTFIDDKTRYTWVYILKRKDRVFEQFLEWKALAEKSTGQELKVLRTNNGGEFTSTEFEGYLRKEGIKHELTVLKNSEQNRMKERMNRTFVETARFMLAEAKLPRRFWAVAVATAVYLQNSGCLGVWRMLTYPRTRGHVTCSPGVNNPKARRCIFLGYGMATKGYRLYDVNHSKVLCSRDVVFDESKPGVEKEPKDDEQRKPAEQDMYLDTGSDAESVVGQAKPMDGQAEEMVDQGGPVRGRPVRER